MSDSTKTDQNASEELVLISTFVALDSSHQ
jgi:hypothetical protein